MAETKRQFEEKTGACIIEGYSLTEGMMACCVNPVRGTQKLGSIGLPVSDVEVRIVDAEDAEKRRIRKVMLYFSTLIALLSLLCVQKLFEMKK